MLIFSHPNPVGPPYLRGDKCRNDVFPPIAIVGMILLCVSNIYTQSILFYGGMYKIHHIPAPTNRISVHSIEIALKSGKNLHGASPAARAILAILATLATLAKNQPLALASGQHEKNFNNTHFFSARI